MKRDLFTYLQILIKHWKAHLMYFLAWITTFSKPLNNNKFFCISMSGNSYGDNIKSLSDFICKQSIENIVVWAFTSDFLKKSTCPHISVELYSYKYYCHLLTSKFILSNARLNKRMIHKRAGQIYLQTWHGTALKKLGTDIPSKDVGVIKRLIRQNVFLFDVANTDIMISGSKFMTNIYRNSFHFGKDLYEVGTPRNDIFFQKNLPLKEKICRKYRIDENKKILLYAPTFRSDGTFEYYNIDYNKIINTWREKVKQDCVFLIRLHPNLMRRSPDIDKMFPKAINVSDYPDMQELLYACDMLITDYSSTIFDFMFTYRPILLYIADYKTYDRGFYFNFNELPFMILFDNNSIEEVLNNFDERSYQKAVDNFLQKIGSVENGNAARQTYDILCKSLS